MATLIGSTDVTGGSSDTFGDGDSAGTRYQCATSGTVDTLLMYMRASGGDVTVKLAIYSDSSGSPNTVLGQTNAITTISSDVVRSAALISNVDVTSGTFYWLFMLVDSTGSTFNATKVGTAGYRGNTGFTTFQDPWLTAADFTNSPEGLPIQGDGTAGSTWPPGGTADAASKLRVVQSNLRLS